MSLNEIIERFIKANPKLMFAVSDFVAGNFKELDGNDDKEILDKLYTNFPKANKVTDCVSLPPGNSELPEEFEETKQKTPLVKKIAELICEDNLPQEVRFDGAPSLYDSEAERRARGLCASLRQKLNKSIRSGIRFRFIKSSDGSFCILRIMRK